MKIYLDTRCIQRLLDERSQPRIAIEADAIQRILIQVKTGNLFLVSSEVLLFEARKNRDHFRKQHAEEILQLADETVSLSETVERLTDEYLVVGIDLLDAYHLACSINAESDFMLTCDDRFLKKAKLANTRNTIVCLPSEFQYEDLP